MRDEVRAGQRFRFLLPPYHADLEEREIPCGPLPLGTIAVGMPPGPELDPALGSPLLLLPLAVPLVQVLGPDHNSLPREPVLIPPGFGRQPVIHPSGTPLTPAAILCAVNTRLPPAAEIVAIWFSDRLNSPALYPLLMTVLGRESAWSAAPSTPTARRNLQRQLCCCYRDFRSLLRLAGMERLERNAEQLAFTNKADVARLRHRVREGLGVSLPEYNRMPGWEWVLEAAVRRGLGAGGWGLGAGGWGLGAGGWGLGAGGWPKKT